MGNLNSATDEYKRNHSKDTFSPSELANLRKSWERAKMDREIGEEILLTLIERRPGFVAYFGFHELQSSVILNSHLQIQLVSQKVETLLDDIVTSLGILPEDTVWQLPYNGGSMHYYKGINLTKDDWNLIREVIIDKVINVQNPNIKICHSHKKTYETELKVWHKLMDAVLCEMKRGFLDEAKKNCA